MTVLQIWTGDVVEDQDFEGLRRSISMTWSDCDVEVGGCVGWYSRWGWVIITGSRRLSH